ncbi:MAG: class I SAM-dependent methyltransferase [Candidatus Muiribacteriota bacterium]
MNNYDFCVTWVKEKSNNRKIKVLDYGCGAGQIVKRFRAEDIEAYGCDVFFEGGDYSKSVGDNLFENGIIRRMGKDNIIPFDDNYFDFIVNNQVFEHVENTDCVLKEISRVLKSDGVLLSIFPDKSVWREGHCGIPFLHWFPKKSKFRIFYACIFRAIGFGYHKKNKSILKWSRDFCEWLDNWTYYRNYSEIEYYFKKYFKKINHIEHYWLKKRLNSIVSYRILLVLPIIIRKLLVKKMCGLVFESNN